MVPAAGELLAELSARATREGANVGLWPGLTIYRFSAPTEPQWEEIQSLSLGIIAQGRKAVTADGKRYVYDQFNYLVLNNRQHFQAQVLEASHDTPFLSFVLQIDPTLVREVSAEMVERRDSSSVQSPAVADQPEDKAVVSALDDELTSSVLRFMRSLAAGPDRRVLAPLYLREMVYRVLQREQFARMLRLAAHQTASNPVAAALTYVATHLADPLTVSTLAEQVSLSPSAFSRSFREVTGQSPYQFVKAMRLDRARELLIEGRLSVEDLSRTVGYTSTSHFIKGFRSRFGSTPGDYANAHSLSRELSATRAVAD